MKALKQLLKENNISQRNLASHLGISPASVSLMLNHNQYPKSPNKSIVINGINRFLTDHGIKFDTQPKQQHPSTKTTTQQEDELMLLRKQTLTESARKHFKLFSNPFTNDIRSADELYQSSDTAYVRAAMHHTAKHGGFIAVVGESGAGKTTLKRDLIDRLKRENQSIIAIEPYVLAAEDNDIKGKTLKAAHIAEAILNALAPLEHIKRSPEARFRQVHNVLKESHKAGNSHVLIIEEAHSLPIPTLKHLKRFFELEDGYDKLLGIILIGQNELGLKLSEQNPTIREVVQRCEIVTLQPIAPAELGGYLAKRLGKNQDINSIIDDSGINAIVSRLVRTDSKGKVTQSLMYPLAIGNLLTGAMNHATELGIPVINADLIMNV
ncbi:AAA family ATPase [Psychrobacter lutiphocae]|uniref:AAA family ATPase n=1 Tax=Psychrobacter lutiphocae TaxID=540500 RepID=UPI00036BB971|nr:AAA family ATPase [Psychrobacter lutiphocae]